MKRDVNSSYKSREEYENLAVSYKLYLLWNYVQKQCWGLEVVISERSIGCTTRG